MIASFTRGVIHKIKTLLSVSSTNAINFFLSIIYICLVVSKASTALYIPQTSFCIVKYRFTILRIEKNISMTSSMLLFANKKIFRKN